MTAVLVSGIEQWDVGSSRTLVGDCSSTTGRSGETGRRAGLKIPWGSPPVWVRFPPPALASACLPGCGAAGSPAGCASFGAAWLPSQGRSVDETLNDSNVRGWSFGVAPERAI